MDYKNLSRVTDSVHKVNDTFDEIAEKSFSDKVMTKEEIDVNIDKTLQLLGDEWKCSEKKTYSHPVEFVHIVFENYQNPSDLFGYELDLHRKRKQYELRKLKQKITDIWGKVKFDSYFFSPGYYLMIKVSIKLK